MLKEIICTYDYLKAFSGHKLLGMFMVAFQVMSREKREKLIEAYDNHQLPLFRNLLIEIVVEQYGDKYKTDKYINPPLNKDFGSIDGLFDYYLRYIIASIGIKRTELIEKDSNSTYSLISMPYYLVQIIYEHINNLVKNNFGGIVPDINDCGEYTIITDTLDEYTGTDEEMICMAWFYESYLYRVPDIIEYDELRNVKYTLNVRSLLKLLAYLQNVKELGQTMSIKLINVTNQIKLREVA